MCIHRTNQSPRGTNIARYYQSQLKRAVLTGKIRSSRVETLISSSQNPRTKASCTFPKKENQATEFRSLLDNKVLLTISGKTINNQKHTKTDKPVVIGKYGLGKG